MMSNRKQKSFSEDGEVKLRSRSNSAKVKEHRILINNTMSTETKDFIQKICYRKTASIDMTQYGFINDNKINPVNYMIKPLKAQLEKICVKPVAVKHRNPLPDPTRSKITERKPHTPKSALSCSGTSSSRTRFRKVRIQSDKNPSPVLPKKVRLVSPKMTKGKIK